MGYRSFSVHPYRACEPSQNGFEAEWPQRHKWTVSVGGSITCPSASTISMAPIT